jgi:hypothetical protein
MRPSQPVRYSGWAVAALAIGAAAPEEVPRDVVDVRVALARAPMATIRGGGVEATIALPDPAKGFYRGTRFDWAGMIVEVHHGQHRFYGPWFDGIASNIRDFTDDGRSVVAGPQTAATGPAEEFVGPAADPVPGYGAASVGGTFLKIGVGRLRKADDKPYSRFRSYQIVDGGHWETRRTAGSVTFRQMVAPDSSGYGYAYEKVVRLGRNGVLEITHELKNNGTRPIVTQVYNHNFTRFDDRDIGPGDCVEFPYPLTGSTVTPQLAAVKGSVLCYLAPLPAGDHVTLAANGFTRDPRTSGFTIIGSGGAQVSAVSDTPIVRSQLWSVRRVVAVEPYLAIDLAPGAEMHWTWRYTFTLSPSPRHQVP